MLISCSFFLRGTGFLRKPLDGYRDLQLSIRIEEMVCELQLNTEKVVFREHHANCGLLRTLLMWLTSVLRTKCHICRENFGTCDMNT